MNEVFLPPFVVNDFDPVLPQSQVPDWGIGILNIPTLHADGLKGAGIKVAVVDTGTDIEHPDLKGGIVQHHNVTGEAYAWAHGHGTGVSGVIGARDNNTGVIGVAPECELIVIKAMRESGGGSINEIANGINLAIQLGAKIINLSLGTSSDVPSLKNIIEKATNAGVLVVCAAGNDGRDNSVNYPARYPSCVAVAAINQENKVSSFSSRGWEVDIAAPGERILTCWRNHGYARVSGTSFSAPYVSGVLALLLQAGLTINHSRLEQTAIDIEEPGKDIKSGYGLINPVDFIKKFGHNATPAPIVPSTPAPIQTTPAPTAADISKVYQAYELLGEFIKNNF